MQITRVYFPSFVRRAVRLATALVCLAAPSYGQTIERQKPCDAFSAASIVFTGVAAAPITRRIEVPDQLPFDLTVTPVRVDHVYAGVARPVIYVTPLGITAYAEPGRRYLFYGRAYSVPGIVMASPGVGATAVEQARDDLQFLDALPPAGGGGAVSGTVQQTEELPGRAGLSPALRGDTPKPLAGIVVRVFNATHSTETVTGPAGDFAVAGLPAGQYRIEAGLPDGLEVAVAAGHVATVRDGGCATAAIDVVANGRLRGVLRGPDGRPLPSTSVDLMPADVPPDGAGRVNGTGSVSTNAQGEFEFSRRRPGIYYLGVGLYSAPNPNGPSYPRTYYPGTTDRAAALPIVLTRAGVLEGLDFSIPTVLARGELEVIVENDLPGNLRLCLAPVVDGVATSSSWSVRAGVPHVVPVVDGQRYSVHVHLESASGHLESEPVIITGAPRKDTLRLHPDAPRNLHP